MLAAAYLDRVEAGMAGLPGRGGTVGTRCRCPLQVPGVTKCRRFLTNVCGASADGLMDCGTGQRRDPEVAVLL